MVDCVTPEKWCRFAGTFTSPNVVKLGCTCTFFEQFLCRVVHTELVVVVT
jgi:hypothetical protein